MTRITTCPDAASVAERAAAQILRELERARGERGVAHLALSGGATPRSTYELLAAEPRRLDAVQVWFADERCVGPEDPESNYRLARETLLERAQLPRECVHRMRGELGPQLGAERYAAELARAFGGAHPVPSLDVVVLGIGPDGHVASLFPGAEALGASEDLLCVGVEDSPKPPPQRISLTLGVLRAARSCVLLATGPSKADAVSAALGEPSRHAPASLLRRERLTVIVDDAAAPPQPLS